MTIFVIIHLVIAVVALGIGIFVFLGDPRNITNQSFFVFAIGLAVLAFVKPFFLGTKNIAPILFSWWGFMMVVLGVYCFAISLSEMRITKRSFISLLPWIILFPLLPGVMTISLCVTGSIAHFWHIYGVLFPLLTLIMAAYLMESFFLCFRRSRGMSNPCSFPPRGIVLVAVFSASIIFISDFLLPEIGVFWLMPVSNFCSLIVLTCGGYGVLRYGAWHGGTALRRGVSYFFSLLAVAVLFFGIEFGIEKFFYQNDEVVDIFAAIVGALAFQPLHDFFDKMTERIFFRNACPLLDAIKELSCRLNSSLDRDMLPRALDSFLQRTIRPTETVFCSVSDVDEVIILESGFRAPDVVMTDYLALATLVLTEGSDDAVFADQGRIWFRKDIFPDCHVASVIAERAARLGVATIVPIPVRGKIRMIIMVGYKASGAFFNEDDREFLGFIARRTTILLENLELREMMERQAEKLEEHILAKTERLKNMYESQSQFLADVSHELKTPLAILKMHAHVFSNSKNAKQKKAWYVMDTTLDRLTRLVSDLLDAAREKTSCGIPQKKRIALHELLSEVYDDCAILAEDKGIRLSLQSEKISVFGERDKLKEVVLNLLGNALRHTPSGGTIFLSTRAIDHEAEIAVRDNGSGIARGNIPHIFERFYRIEEGAAAGTGIGLYLCRQIIERHGGTVTVTSEIGKGSCFVVHLPLALWGSS